MIQKTNSLFFLIFIFSFVSQTILTYDNSHFYRATYFFGEPRFEKKGLTSADLFIGGGSTCQGYDACGHKTCLLNIYGPHNMLYLGKGVPGQDLSRETDALMQKLSVIPQKENFGKLLFSGQFNAFEIIFSFAQNFTKGFFFQIYLPVRKLEIRTISHCDLSPTKGQQICQPLPCSYDSFSCNNNPYHRDCDNECSCMYQFSDPDYGCPNDKNMYWQAFLRMFPRILQEHQLSISDVCMDGSGDTTCFLGWTTNYDNLENIDYIDGTIRLGIVAPTSYVKDPDYAFSLPLGYDGHTGFIASLDTSFGLYEWVTIGGHLDLIIFNKKSKCIRVKTACEQNGFIKLAKANVCYEKGNLYNFGAYFKADHVIGGFSCILGYILAAKQDDYITPFDFTCIDCDIANSDQMLKQWRMHTINFLAEYDFSRENHAFGPRVGIFYNVVVGGRRIFATGMGGANFGFEVSWNL